MYTHNLYTYLSQVSHQECDRTLQQSILQTFVSATIHKVGTGCPTFLLGDYGKEAFNEPYWCPQGCSKSQPSD